MREAKLKAWVKERKIMADVLIVNYKESTVQLPIETDVTDDYWWDETVWSFEEIELLQYTGLTDKNGKEIYEGDIIEITNHPFTEMNYNGKYEVYYDKDTMDICCGGLLLFRMRHFAEVIGNRFEHPHLLEEST